MRRLLWQSLCVFLGLVFLAALVYLANPLSARTWILGKALRSGVSSVRDTAMLALVARDPEEAAEVFVEARLEASSGSILEESIFRFAILPPEAAATLEGMLADPDPLRAAAAADGLAVLAHKNEYHDFSGTLPALFLALQTKHQGLCIAAAYAISQIGPRNPDATKAILRAFREGCRGALGCLHGMELSDGDLRELLGFLDHEDLQLREQAALGLCMFTDHKERIVPRLVAALGDPNDVVAEAALYSLERLEQADRATIMEVIALLGRKDRARPAAIRFLAGCISASPEALAAIQAGLRESSQAREFLEGLDHAAWGTLPADLIPDLLHLCSPGMDFVQRRDAVETLGNMGPTAKPAAPGIEEILAKDDDEDFEWAARIALESINRGE
jgi:HEAT repeat protein